jgi:hypothetical protein
MEQTDRLAGYRLDMVMLQPTGGCNFPIGYTYSRLRCDAFNAWECFKKGARGTCVFLFYFVSVNQLVRLARYGNEHSDREGT